ncbi:hypothetical protein HYS97_03710, partial [Candidatus Daviesbacteria bacterium]|nr:hypothetical protein [Candidatus Daviesbacteria bacterium]
MTLLAGIIVGLYLTKTKQILRPKAEVAPITFLEGKCVQERNGRKVLTCLENVEIQFVSTLNATPSPSQTSTASASPSASASASPAACNPKKFDSSTWKIEKKEEC